MTTTDEAPAENFTELRDEALRVLGIAASVFPDDQRVNLSVSAYGGLHLQPYTDDPAVGAAAAAALGLTEQPTTDPGTGYLHHTWTGTYRGQRVQIAVLQTYPLGHVVPTQPEQAR